MFGFEKVDQKTYHSSIKPMHMPMSHAISGFSNHKKGALRQEISKRSRGQNRLFHYPEACSKWFAARCRKVGGAL
jgi:hypothetical protein